MKGVERGRVRRRVAVDRAKDEADCRGERPIGGGGVAHDQAVRDDHSIDGAHRCKIAAVIAGASVGVAPSTRVTATCTDEKCLNTAVTSEYSSTLAPNAKVALLLASTVASRPAAAVLAPAHDVAVAGTHAASSPCWMFVPPKVIVWLAWVRAT
eukprot:7383291-Prymnesium_polylepis.1